MSLPILTTRTVRPARPGEMLHEDFMPDYCLTVASLAEAAGVSRQTVNELLRERRALTPEMACAWLAYSGTAPTSG
jgi:antitoxin HigA-1